MITSRRTRATLAAAILVVGLSACGSDDSDDGDTTTTEAEAASTTSGSDSDESTTTEGDDSGDDSGDDAEAMARAEAANVTIDDLPDGWTATPPGDDSNNVFDTCGEVDIEAVTVAKARSDQFETQADDGGQMTISSTSGVLTGEDEATALVEQFTDEAFATCVADALRDELGAAQVEGSLAAAASDELPDVADQVGALSGTFTITDPTAGDTIELKAAVVAIRTGDLVTTLTVATIDTAGDGDLFESLVGTVAERQAG